MPLQDNDIFFVTKADGSDTRKIRADKLFSGIADDWYVLVRESAGSRYCLVSDLKNKASDDRYMLVNQPDQVDSSPRIGPITDVGLTGGVDYSQYVKLIDLNNGSDITNATYAASSGVINDVFDGDESTSYYRGPEYQLLNDPNKGMNPKFVFTPPSPIKVGGLIEVKGGFSGSSRAGFLKINGEVVLELRSYDLNPQWFSVAYSGEINLIEFHQKKYIGSPDGVDKDYGKFINATLAVNAFKIDGEYLLSNQQVTYLDFANGTNFDGFAYNDPLTEVDVNGAVLDATGKVGGILPDENRIILLTEQPNWDIGSYVKGRENIVYGDVYKNSYKIKSSTVVSQYAGP